MSINNVYFKQPQIIPDLTIMKTSEEWYKTVYLPNHNDMLSIWDPDGWRDLPNPNHYWHNVPILYSEFVKRADRCTIGKFLGYEYSVFDKEI